MSRRLASTVPRHGCGTSRRSSNSRPATPNRSVTGHGRPKEISVAWMRCLSIERCLTRCIRKRACSRSRRTRGSGSQISGTRSRCDSTASTRASILSVLHASGARPLTLGRVGDQHVPPELFQAVMHESRAGHRLDHPAHRQTMRAGASRQAAHAVRVRRRRPLLDHLAARRQQADIDLAATQIHPACNMKTGLLELAPR